MMPSKNNNRILIVDDENSNIVKLTHILTPEYSVFAAESGQIALKMVKDHAPNIILLDIMMPDMDGFEVLTRLKDNDDTRDIPVIIVTGLNKSETEEKGLAMGAADYIIKPFNSTIVKLRIHNQIKILNQIDMIRHLSTTDQLTSISNRRNFDYRLCIEWDRAKRDQTPLSLFMIDIDNFKNYNDIYGHLQGDLALQTVAKVSEQSLRRSLDFIARWGGEEFAVLLSDTDIAGALIVAENIRENIEITNIPCPNGKKTNITVSIGVNNCIPTQEHTVKDFFNGADNALYKAKKEGKNRVCVYKE